MENPAVVGVTAVLEETFELDETGEVLIPRGRRECVVFLCYLFFISAKRLTAHVISYNGKVRNRRAAALFNKPAHPTAGNAPV